MRTNNGTLQKIYEEVLYKVPEDLFPSLLRPLVTLKLHSLGKFGSCIVKHWSNPRAIIGITLKFNRNLLSDLELLRKVVAHEVAHIVTFWKDGCHSHGDYFQAVCAMLGGVSMLKFHQVSHLYPYQGVCSDCKGVTRGFYHKPRGIKVCPLCNSQVKIERNQS